MLTKEEIEQLQPLTLHPKYGFILKEAIEKWSLPKVNPRAKNWGIDLSKDRYVLEQQNCCLLGCYLLDKDNVKNKLQEYAAMLDHIEYYTKLDPWELFAIMEGFDQNELSIEAQENHKEAYKFGKDISLILFGEL